MAANKVKGVRAALCHSPDAATLTRQHNDANVLTLAGWQTTRDDVMDIVDNFMNTEFEGGRHARRVDKIRNYEEENC
jgi:ribose 5-phosphate isomerase B